MQSEKAYSPMYVTVFGIDTERNLVHSEKARHPISLRLEEKSTFSNEEHS